MQRLRAPRLLGMGGSWLGCWVLGASSSLQAVGWMNASSIAEVLVMGLVLFNILLTILMSEWSVLFAGLCVIKLGGGRNVCRAATLRLRLASLVCFS